MEHSPSSEILLYQTEDARTRVEVRFDDSSAWLTQAQMAELFQTSKANISMHLKNIFEEGELGEDSVVKYYLTTAADGKNYQVRHYNLEAILSVGYRVRSVRGTQFRQWATAQLHELLLKGFVLDNERLKNPPGPGTPDYFDELLEQIRDIRSSEKRMYLRVRDIFALAADYRVDNETTTRFFQTIQNKLLFAATGNTAPEIVAGRADHARPNMNLTNWKTGMVRKGDVTIAKNYLNEDEIGELNRIVSMFLDFAEDQARRRKQIFMTNWEERLNDFLQFNDRAVLPDIGKISRKQADQLAEAEYTLFENRRRTLKEAEGEEEMMRQLETAAQKPMEK